MAGCGDDGEGGLPAATPTSPPATATATRQATATLPATATATASPAPTGTPTSDNPVVNLPVDATIELDGLPATADVAVDSLGIPHVFAPDERTAIFLQGYETAKARFWQMDVFRRFAEGRLSELFGELTFGDDAEMRTLFTTRDGRRIEQALWERLQQDAPDVAALAQAYADGVNAWLADLRGGRNGAVLPPEYSFFIVGLGADDLADWRPQDTLAIGRLQAFSLSSSADEEVAGAAALAALPEAVFLDIYRSAPAAPATVLPPAAGNGAQAGAGPTRATPPLPPLETLHAVRDMLDGIDAANPFSAGEERPGSNNWIVSPQLSASGHAMLANDPHLALYNPPIWHMIQLDAGASFRPQGVIFPGLPGIILGMNDVAAWGGTVSNFDVSDVYLETVTTPDDYPAAPRTVLFKGAQVPVLRVEEPIRLKGGAEIPIVIEVVPHHGPMMPDPNPNDEVQGLAATNMTYRWTGHEVTLDLLFLIHLNRARNVAEFKSALRYFATGGQNWIWADVSGDTAYFPYTLVPQRPPGAVPYLPMPGTGEAEWLTDDQGDPVWLPEEKFPQAVNPPQGYLVTANNDQNGNTLDNDPLNDEAYFTFTHAMGFRAQRIDDLLSNRAGVRPPDGKIAMADMSAYQYDTASLEASRLVPFLFAAAEQRPDLVDSKMAAAIDRLRAWGTGKEGSPAWTMSSGVDPAEGRDDVPPRPTPPSDEEKADAVAASIYAAWSTRLARAVFTDDFAGTGIPAPGDEFATKGLLHILEDVERMDPGFVVHTKGENGQSTLWDDKETPEVETRDELLLGALRNGVQFLEDKFDSEAQADWLWGKIHRVRYQHFFGQAGINTFDLGPLAAPGGRDTVNPAAYSLRANDFTFSGGPSKRFVAVLDPAGPRAVNVLPGGENGNPGGVGPQYYNRIQPEIHYGDHVPAWINGGTFEYRLSRADVAADTQLHLRYVPRAEP